MNTRIYGLDIMRAAAIIGVMHSHCYDYSRHFVDISWYRYLTFDGVGLFFVLSGFLIGRQLIRQFTTGKTTWGSIGQFWFRRWMRTLPAYYAILSLLTILYFIKRSYFPENTIGYFTFTQNLYTPHPEFFAEAWSLSVEEWFYFTAPLLFAGILFLFPSKKLTIPVTILCFVFSITLVRCLKASQLDDTDFGAQFGQQIAKLVVLRADAIMLGVLGAWVSLTNFDFWQRYRKLLFVSGCVLLVLCNVLRSEFFLSYFHYSVMPLGALLLLPLLSSVKTGSGCVYRAITFISIISYSMYLTNHMLIQRGVLTVADKLFGLKAAGSPGMLLLLLAFWMGTFCASWMLYRFVEKPFLKLRDRISETWKKKTVAGSPVEVVEGETTL